MSNSVEENMTEKVEKSQA